MSTTKGFLKEVDAALHVVQCHGAWLRIINTELADAIQTVLTHYDLLLDKAVIDAREEQKRLFRKSAKNRPKLVVVVDNS